MKARISSKACLLAGAVVVCTVFIEGAAFAQAAPATDQPAPATDSASAQAAPAASLAPATNAPAQAVATTSTGGADQAIVVTARRREEKLSDVPVSVAAFGSSQLQERHIVTEADLQSSTAGLTVRETGSSNQVNFSLRGQSIDAFSFASPAVLVYFDEFNAQGATASGFYDLDSVQVLKGPQGTLFGRNATGGAVLYQSARPDKNKFGGYLTLDYGNYNDRKVEGAINTPLGDIGAFRISAQYEKRDGFQHNLLLGIKNGSLNNFSVRPSLLLTPASGFSSLTVFQYGRYGGRSTALKADSIYTTGQTNNGIVLSPAIPSSVIYGPGVQLNNPAVTALFSSLQDYAAKQGNYGFYDVFDNTTAQHRARQYLITNTTAYDLSDSARIKNVVGYNYVHSFDQTDVDGTPFAPLVVGYYSSPASLGYVYHDKQLSNELQLSGTALDKRLTYIVGGYYFFGRNQQHQPLGIGPDLASGPIAMFLRTFQQDSFSKAMFGQVTYKIAPRLNLTVGGRYTWELTKFKPLAGDVNIAAGVGPTKRQDSKPSWNVSLDYKVTPSLLVYAAQRGSWRTGGFNGTATNVVNGATVINSYEPETTYDYEIGAKFQGRIANRPARLNVAFYDQYIHNVIRAIYEGVSAVSGNVKRARVTGVEADGEFDVTDWLRFGGTFAYTNGRYTDPSANVAGGAFSFGPYADAPKMSGSAFARVSHELPGDGGELALRGDFYAQEHFFYSNLNDTIIPGTRIAGYHLIDGRLEWENVEGTRISVAAFAKNITGEKYNVGGFALGAVLGINSVLPGLPRTYGVEASIKF